MNQELFINKKCMGNADLVMVFNDHFVITVKGNDYTTYNEGVDKGYHLYKKEAKDQIDYWHKAEKEQPDMVEKDYDVEGAWEIKSLRVYRQIT